MRCGVLECQKSSGALVGRLGWGGVDPHRVPLEVGSRSGDVTVMFAERFPELLRWWGEV